MGAGLERRGLISGGSACKRGAYKWGAGLVRGRAYKWGARPCKRGS